MEMKNERRESVLGMSSMRSCEGRHSDKCVTQVGRNLSNGRKILVALENQGMDVRFVFWVG
jgi:hypothetical protein